ncbi:MAG: caspase family protein [Armatimonadetes bacterium]|nr:caspase family protein [Armatimonadota bacterium]
MNVRCAAAMICACLAGLVPAQGWSEAYDRALEATAGQSWDVARTAFLDAVALRPEDQSRPTSLPGPVTDPRLWRGGSPYSPNFGAAYASYRHALTLDPDDRREALEAGARELEVLLAKGQTSPETYFFLNSIYARLRDGERMEALKARLESDQSRLGWQVDTSFLVPADRAAVRAAMPPAYGGPSGANPGGVGPKTTVIKARDLARQTTAPAYALTSLAGPVPVVPTKYALVIGNGESMMEDQRLSYAASDALLIREALVENAGYAVENVDVVVNASAAQIMASAQALADRMPQDGTVLIYFTGAGFNIAGRDYYAGIDAESPLDSLHMAPVGDVYRMFVAKGASIFAFMQAHRPKTAGLYFGRETPMFGRISQSHATIPGERINGLVTGGREVGAYSTAFAEILAEFRSNQVPIMEFVWKVFYNLRQGGSPQTPTLPVLTVMAADARF